MVFSLWGRRRWRKWETFTALHPICFCLQHVRANTGHDQTFTKNKTHKGSRAQHSSCVELKLEKGMRVRGVWSSVSQLLFCCGQEYVVAVLNKCIQGSGAARWGHGVTQSEGAPADKSLGGSTRPPPPAQGVTAEYTWPGSFRPSRDNWERLPPRLQPKLTKGIMCGGRSKQSKVDSVNVWLRYHAEVSVCTFTLVCVRIGEALGQQEEAGLLTAVCFSNLCVCHTRLKAGHSKKKRK